MLNILLIKIPSNFKNLMDNPLTEVKNNGDLNLKTFPTNFVLCVWCKINEYVFVEMSSLCPKQLFTGR